MIKSMTAYARSEKTNGKLDVRIEIRSYNSRHLDVVLRIPHACLPLEDKMKQLITSMLERGRIEGTVFIKDESREAQGFEVNESIAKAYRDALDRLKHILNIEDPISLSLLAGVSGIIQPAEIERNMEKYWEIIQPCMIDTLHDLNTMRINEGKYIAEDLGRRLHDIENCILEIENNTKTMTFQYKKKLEMRIAELTSGLIDIDPGRIAQEAAFLADRSDISEEIVRSRSHIEQFRGIMAAEAPGGRKLNFLIQELNREFNTMGAKTPQADVSHIIVDLKSELEKIREQIQNIE